jgi:aspartate/methionine/tyrosine aminotransferase
VKAEPREAIPLVLKVVGEMVFQSLSKTLSACQTNVGWAILVKKDINALLVPKISYADVSPVGTDPSK